MNENLPKIHFDAGESAVPPDGPWLLRGWGWGRLPDDLTFMVDAAPQTINLPPIRSMRDASCPHI